MRMKEVSQRENRGLARASEGPAEGRCELQKISQKKSADFSNPNEGLQGIVRTSEVVPR